MNTRQLMKRSKSSRRRNNATRCLCSSWRMPSDTSWSWSSLTFVARKGLDDVGEHASIMAARLEARSLQKPRKLAAQQRDAVGAAVVDLGRKQAGENTFATGPGRFVKALHHDAVHQHRAMHRRSA